MSTLKQIQTEIEQCLVRKHKPLLVFDLDSTLFDVSPRIKKILLKYATDEKHQKQFPQATQLLKEIQWLKSDWGIGPALQRVGLDQSHPEFLHSVQEYWRQHFFSNEALHDDVPYEGAVEFVQKWHQQGVYISYLTGRDVFRMGEGTVQVLKKWNFPLDATASLVLKPFKEMDDAQFKTDWFLSLHEGQPFQDIWFFENEPVNINKLRQHLPHIRVVFFDSTHSGQEPPPSDIPSILHFLTEGIVE